MRVQLSIESNWLQTAMECGVENLITHRVCQLLTGLQEFVFQWLLHVVHGNWSVMEAKKNLSDHAIMTL